MRIKLKYYKRVAVLQKNEVITLQEKSLNIMRIKSQYYKNSHNFTRIKLKLCDKTVTIF